MCRRLDWLAITSIISLPWQTDLSVLLPIRQGQSNKHHYLRAAHLSLKTMAGTERKAGQNQSFRHAALLFSCLLSNFLLNFNLYLIKSFLGNSLGNLFLVNEVRNGGQEEMAREVVLDTWQYPFCFGGTPFKRQLLETPWVLLSSKPTRALTELSVASRSLNKRAMLSSTATSPLPCPTRKVT